MVGRPVAQGLERAEHRGAGQDPRAGRPQEKGQVPLQVRGPLSGATGGRYFCCSIRMGRRLSFE